MGVRRHHSASAEDTECGWPITSFEWTVRSRKEAATSTLTKFTRSAAILTIGAAAAIGVPTLASAATQFTITEPGSCATAPSVETSVNGSGNLRWKIDGTKDVTTTGATVDYYQFGDPFTGGSGPLSPGKNVGGVDKAGAFTIHLLNGGAYDPNGVANSGDECTVGSGFAVTP